MDMVCTIKVFSLQIQPVDAIILRQESQKDPVNSTLMRYVREGWPSKNAETNDKVTTFRKLSDSLSTCHGCLIHGSRVVILQSLQSKVLDLLHLGHFGMERMKQLARTAVCWPGIDAAIEMASRRCDSCGEHQNKPSNPPVHTLVTDNAPTFTSEEFQHWCKERGITHLTGAPYHPATNGAAERLVQTFKQALRKSSLPLKRALQDFMMQYRRTPTSCGFSPSELLNSRQLRTRIDSLLPSPAHIAQGRQSKETSKSQVTPDSGGVAKVSRQYKAGDPVYALYHGPRRDRHPRWVPAIVKKSLGTRCFNVKVVPHGPLWRRNWEQLQPRYVTDEDNEPGNVVDNVSELSTDHPMEAPGTAPQIQRHSRTKTVPPVPEYGPDNPRRSRRTCKPNQRYCC